MVYLCRALSSVPVALCPSLAIGYVCLHARRAHPPRAHLQLLLRLRHAHTLRCQLAVCLALAAAQLVSQVLPLLRAADSGLQPRLVVRVADLLLRGLGFSVRLGRGTAEGTTAFRSLRVLGLNPEKQPGFRRALDATQLPRRLWRADWLALSAQPWSPWGCLPQTDGICAVCPSVRGAGTWAPEPPRSGLSVRTGCRHLGA
jgi:hypothetical protein